MDRSPHFDFWSGCLEVAFDEQQIHRCEEFVEDCILGLVGFILGIRFPEYGTQSLRDNAHPLGPGNAMAVRVFARRIQLMLMMRMLDGCDTQLLADQFLDQFNGKGGLSVVFTTNNMESIHGVWEPLDLSDVFASERC